MSNIKLPAGAFLCKNNCGPDYHLEGTTCVHGLVQRPRNVSPNQARQLLSTASTQNTNAANEQEYIERLTKLDWDELPSDVQSKLNDLISPDHDDLTEVAADAVRFSGLEGITKASTWDSDRGTIELDDDSADVSEINTEYLTVEQKELYDLIVNNEYYSASHPVTFPLKENDTEHFHIGDSPLFDPGNEEARAGFLTVASEIYAKDRAYSGTVIDAKSVTWDTVNDWYGEGNLEDTLFEGATEEEISKFAELDAKHGGYAKALIGFGNGTLETIKADYVSGNKYLTSSGRSKDEWTESDLSDRLDEISFPEETSNN